MNIAVLMGAFFVLLFLGVPIAYSLCLSAVLYMALFMDVPMIIIGQQMLKGVDSFTLMAIPFFVIAGGLMESGGISKRIVNFARTVVGHLPGGLAIVTVVASMIFAAMTGHSAHSMRKHFQIYCVGGLYGADNGRSILAPGSCELYSI